MFFLAYVEGKVHKQQEIKAEKIPWTSPLHRRFPWMHGSSWFNFVFKNQGVIASGNLSYTTIVSKSSVEIVDFPIWKTWRFSSLHRSLPRMGSFPWSRTKVCRIQDLVTCFRWEGPKSSMREMWPAVFFMDLLWDEGQWSLFELRWKKYFFSSGIEAGVFGIVYMGMIRHDRSVRFAGWYKTGNPSV